MRSEFDAYAGSYDRALNCGLALSGDSKEYFACERVRWLAARLSLSPNTVHHYIKAIHRHFRVSSRSELLARWVGR